MCEYVILVIQQTYVSVFRRVISGPFVFEEHYKLRTIKVCWYPLLCPYLLDQFEKSISQEWAIFVPQGRSPEDKLTRKEFDDALKFIVLIEYIKYKVFEYPEPII